jgi:replicative DNA helicase
MDKVTNGGMLADGRCLVVFLAQAGLGKSLTLSNIARYNAMNDKKVVIITLELSQDVYAKRIDAHISGCNIDELIGQQKRARSEIDKFNDDHPDHEIIIKEYPPNSVSCSAIDVYLERLKTSGIVADLILIDYLNLLVPRGKQTESSYTDIGNVSREMRALTYKWNAPICTATQANTQGYNSEDIGMENISESRGIAHTADFIMALYQTDEDREAGVIKGAVLKNRLGGYIGKRIPLKLDPFSLRLTDTTDVIDDDEVDSLLDDDKPYDGDDDEPIIDVEMDVHNM